MARNGRALPKLTLPVVLDNVVIRPKTRCWHWTGPRNIYQGKFEYPRYGDIKAHRAVYELVNGPLQKGQFVCHTCDRPQCVNPDHLFAGTHIENMLDMKVKGRNPRSLKTHCPHGHVYDEKNTRWIHDRSGVVRRNCKACEVIRQRNRRAKKRLKAVA